MRGDRGEAESAINIALGAMEVFIALRVRSGSFFLLRLLISCRLYPRSPSSARSLFLSACYEREKRPACDACPSRKSSSAIFSSRIIKNILLIFYSWDMSLWKHMKNFQKFFKATKVREFHGILLKFMQGIYKPKPFFDNFVKNIYLVKIKVLYINLSYKILVFLHVKNIKKSLEKNFERHLLE